MKKILLLFFIFLLCAFSAYAKDEPAFIEERNSQLNIEEELYRQELEYETQEEISEPQELQIEEQSIEPSFVYTAGEPLEGIIIFEEIVLDNIDSNWYMDTKPNATKIITAQDTTMPIEAVLAYQNSYSTLFQPDATIFGMKEFSYGNYINYNNAKLGVKYDNKVTPENFQQIRTLYYEYKKNKYFLNAAYKNTSTDFTKQKSISKIELENSYRITDSLALKYVYSTGKQSSNSDLYFTIYPFKDETINFDIGAGQKFYADKEDYSSRFLFSTEFEF